MEKEKRTVLFLVLVAFVLRAAVIFLLPDYKNPEAYESGAIAENLAGGHGFRGGAWFVAEGPTAFMAPVYPFLIAFFKITGFPYPYLLLQLFQAAMASFAVFLLYRLCLFYVQRIVALISALLLAVYPISIYFSRLVLSSSLTLFLLIASLYFLSCCFHRRRRADPFLAGVSMGAGLLLEPALAFSFAGVFGFLCVRHGKDRSFASVARTLSLIALVTIAVIGPWVWRNYALFDRFIFIKNTAGLNLWQGNHAGATGSLFTREGKSVMASLSPEEVDQLIAMTEIEMNDWFLKKATSFIKAHPLEFARLYLSRLFNFFNPFPPRHFRYVGEEGYEGRFPFLRTLFYSLALLCAAGGLVVALRRGMDLGMIGVAVIAPAFFFALFHLDNHRYRFPYENLMLVFSAVAIQALGERLAPKQ